MARLSGLLVVLLLLLTFNAYACVCRFLHRQFKWIVPRAPTNRFSKPFGKPVMPFSKSDRIHSFLLTRPIPRPPLNTRCRFNCLMPSSLFLCRHPLHAVPIPQLTPRSQLWSLRFDHSFQVCSLLYVR